MFALWLRSLRMPSIPRLLASLHSSTCTAQVPRHFTSSFFSCSVRSDESVSLSSFSQAPLFPPPRPENGRGAGPCRAKEPDRGPRYGRECGEGVDLCSIHSAYADCYFLHSHFVCALCCLAHFANYAIDLGCYFWLFPANGNFSEVLWKPKKVSPLAWQRNSYVAN